MIKCFTFENFKSFEKAEFNIETLTTLIGANSSGKSNAMEGIFILAMASSGIDLNTILDGNKNIGATVRGGSHGCTRFKTSAFKLGTLIDFSETHDLFYEIKVGVNGKAAIEEEGLYLVKTDMLGPKKNKIFKTKTLGPDCGEIIVQYKTGKKRAEQEVICLRTTAILPQLIGKAVRDTAEQREIAGMLERVIEHLKNIRILNPLPSNMRDYVRVSDVDLRTTGDNLAAVLNKMCKNPDNKRFLLNVIKKLPENEIIDIEFIETKIGDVIFALRERFLNSTNLVDARQLSDGTLRCIAVLTAVLMTAPGSMVVIEEIDNGIHPAKIYSLLEQLVQIAKERQIDIIVTTHNAGLLNAYKKEELTGVSVVYRERERGTSKIISLVDIQNFPSVLAAGGLGNAMIDESLLKIIKNKQEKKDYSWLGV